MATEKIPYWQKLQDPRWQKRRLEILQASDWKCSCCNDPSSMLHIHHKFYLKGKEPWEYPDDALLALCESCHKAFAEYSNILLSKIEGRDGDYMLDLAYEIKCTNELGIGLKAICQAIKEWRRSLSHEITEAVANSNGHNGGGI